MARREALDLPLGDSVPALIRDVLCLARNRDINVTMERRHHRPGLDDSAIFRVGVGDPAAERFVVLTTARLEARHATSMPGVYGWVHPHDPRLTGLPFATDPSLVGAWLGEPEVSLTTVSYRPLRRCVLRAQGSRTRYLKVLVPGNADGLLRRHAILQDISPRAVPSPAPGVVLLEGVDGRSLAESYAAWHRYGEQIPEWGSVSGLLDSLPAEVLSLPPRRAWSDRLDFYTTAARAILPGHLAEIDDLERRLQPLLDQLPRGPLVPSHGDFYEANIFATGARVHTLIDVDSVGPGYRVDDYACLLGHLAVLPDLSPKHYASTGEILHRWTELASQEVHPGALRARVAGVLVSLCIGAQPPRSTRRLTLAREWLRSAEQFA
ncbi:MAG: hypothetical protein Q3997_01650 [Propionibacteriaceae bacterium]|nr:hypothetical protein [Propionibacteriaceae bacterium]